MKELKELKELIEVGFVVRFRSGDWAIALRTQDGDIGFYELNNLISPFLYLNSFEEDLTDGDDEVEYDIMEIRGYAESNQTNTTGRSIIWERIEGKVEESLTEIRKEAEEVRKGIRDIREELGILEEKLLDIITL